ncbi:MAG: SusC/RagA family TonB-linked outer membrane protein [Saprospiraceae bacterium]|nr:SusC/RagA family TonB-linked outer membrane protein [Saprospiraceae bacterium]
MNVNLRKGRKVPYLKGILMLLTLCFISSQAWSQLTVTGKVTDAGTSEPLIGVNIMVKGTSQGTVTDIDGAYKIELSEGTETLVFSFIGYANQEIAVNGQSALDIALSEGLALSEAVVTALGIKRDEKSLGYAVQKLNGDEFTEAKEANFVNALSGKVAGVNITNGGSGVGSSARIVIRGESSLAGNNQPLFVVNGIPINNTIGGNGRAEGNLETDYGNGAAEINADDIETISVLKGANATALYGSRAANGVILITTKSGASTNGIGVSINSSTTFENPLRIPEYQNRYGQGSNFQFEFVNGSGAGTADGVDESWGPAFNGQSIPQHDSPTSSGLRAGDFAVRPLNTNGTFADQITATPWNSAPTNIEDFFETGVTTSNNIALFGGDAERNFRLSYTNLYSEGILPNTDLQRNTLNFDANQSFLDNRLRLNANLNYVNSASDNRPNNSYGTENVMYLWVWFGRHIDMNSLRNYWQPGLEGVQQFNYNYNWHDNPYFTMFENTNGFDKDRLFGNVNLTFDLTPKLNLMVRYGLDLFNDLRVGRRAFSTQRFPQGQYREDRVFFEERNADFLLSYKDRFANNINFSLNVGANQMNQVNRFNRTAANELAIPDVYSFNNSAIPLSNSQFNSERRINSVYAAAQIGFGSAIYLDLAGRNDWSSTLPNGNNSYFYPSASASFILSEMIDMPASTFLKLRAGWGEVGNDTDPYSLNSFVEFLTNPYGGQLLATESNVLPNSDLKPERASTFEVGADLRLFNGRVNFDVTYYNTETKNQILEIPVSQTTGYARQFINAGSIRSQGVEALLSLTPVKQRDFSWDVNINFTLNRSKVLSLAEGLETYQIGSNYLQSIAKVGERMGDVYGTGFALVDTDTGERVTVDDVEDIKDSYANLYGSNGLPVRDPNLRRLGNYNPDWLAGIYNTLSYKGFRLGFLFDGRVGGVVMSRTLLIGGTSGMMAETAQFDREATTYIGGVTRVDGVSELDRNGVKEVLSSEGVVSYVPNDIAISARDFYWSHFNRGNEQVGMYDASFLKLREVRLGYTFPKALTSKIGAQKIAISLIGRNLLLWTENPHFDPEVFSFNANTIVPGVEDMATPSARSYGVNLNVTF